MHDNFRRAIVAFALWANVANAQTPSRHASAAKGAKFEVAETSITELQTAMTNGSVSAVQLVDAYLARIAAYDHAGPDINALIRINPNAHADAVRLDAERKAGKIRGPLHGIPIVLKDNYDTGDMPTSAGSLALATSQPARDAFVVKQLRDAGAIVLAKANMHELAAGITSISSLGGQTKNPYDLGRCPGGSSGGTGAAIAASFAAVGWGSDTCGSIRIPSAFNNLFGLRPTQGMVSRTGIVPLSHTQDIGGPLARTATDLAIALDATIGIDSADTITRTQRDHAPIKFVASLNKTALRGARIGVFRNYFSDTDPEIADTIRAAIAIMKANGAEVLDVQVPDFDSLMAGSSVINSETKFDLIDYLRTVPNAPVHSMHDILDGGLYDRALETRFRTIDTVVMLDSDAHRRQLMKQGVLRNRFDALLDSLKLDALVFPTVRQRPTRIGDVQLGSTCNLSAQSGLPALNVPVGFTADGLPVGMELLGRAFTDARLMAIGYSFEQTGSRRRAPPSAPPLVNGKAPSVISFATINRATTISAHTDFTYDATLGALSWRAVVSPTTSRQRLQALVLRRTGTVNSVQGSDLRVVTRLLGPGMHSATGATMLSRVERLALQSGALVLAMYVSDRPTVPITVPLTDVGNKLAAIAPIP